MKKELFLILHDIRSAYNVGAIFRSADGAGVSKIYLTGYTPCPLRESESEMEIKRPKKERLEKSRAIKMIEKTALGAQDWMPWEQYENLDALLAKLKNEKCSIVALEKTAEAIELVNFKPKFPLALIVGNEVEGVCAQTLEKCDAVISLPMRGKKESLNVSVAASIAIYGLLA